MMRAAELGRFLPGIMVFRFLFDSFLFQLGYFQTPDRVRNDNDNGVFFFSSILLWHQNHPSYPNCPIHTLISCFLHMSTASLIYYSINHFPSHECDLELFGETFLHDTYIFRFLLGVAVFPPLVLVDDDVLRRETRMADGDLHMNRGRLDSTCVESSWNDDYRFTCYFHIYCSYHNIHDLNISDLETNTRHFSAFFLPLSELSGGRSYFTGQCAF